jgi:ribosome-associated protein
VTRALTIPGDELAWRFTGSGGPGGQHANTANTKAEVIWDVLGSASVSEWQRARIVQRLGPVVRVSASDRRSQAQNRQLALDRLRERLVDALQVRRERRPTAPTTGSQRRRVEAKRRRAEVKRHRGRPLPDD